MKLIHEEKKNRNILVDTIFYTFQIWVQLLNIYTAKFQNNYHLGVQFHMLARCVANVRDQEEAGATVKGSTRA